MRFVAYLQVNFTWHGFSGSSAISLVESVISTGRSASKSLQDWRCLFPKGTASKCGAEVEAKSAAIAVQASSGRQRHRRHQSGEREKPGTGVLPRCIFNLTMTEMLRKAKSKETADGDMLCSLLQLVRRLIRHELGEQHSQSNGNNNHENSIIQQWKLAKFTKNESTNDSDNQPRWAAANRQRPALRKRQSHKRNESAVAVWWWCLPLFPAVEWAKRKSAVWLTVFSEGLLSKSKP